VRPQRDGDVTTALDVAGIGNALVDVIARVDDAFLAEHGLAKGSMALIDSARAEQLYEAMGSAVEVSGGSAANTMAGLASLGAKVAFVGRVADDQLGEVFAHDIRAAGVSFEPPPTAAGRGSAPTGRCLIAVTPDGQRTMSTLLGASSELGSDDVDVTLLAGAGITYLEGYLFDQEPAREAFHKAAAAAHGAGRRVALTLSDSFCVERFRAEFLEFIETEAGADIVFANEDELRLLYETDDADVALSRVQHHCRLVVMTRGAAGSTVVVEGDRHDVGAEPVARVVDTTGAGDLYAAGFLHGLARGCDPTTCARLGAVVAGEVISHIGARPETSLADLVAPLLR
jgi:sugar/nucleoside kinase (ribokinase family)